MNHHEHTLNLLRNHLHLTPAQQLEVIERSAARQRQRAKSMWRILGIGALCAVTYCLTIVNPILALGAIAVGVAGALFWAWNSGSEGEIQVASSVSETKTMQAMDERLANLEAILNYEEKIAARHRDSPAE